MELANLGARFVAGVIDAILLGIVSALLQAVAGQSVGGVLALLIILAYYWFFWTQRDGQTPGKRVMGIKVVKIDGSGLTTNDVIIRLAGYFINTLLIYIGWLMMLFNRERQGMHDKLAKTYVVKAQ